MFGSFKKLISSEKTNFSQLMADGAIILDVRSHGEFAAGHIADSINIPVNKLAENLPTLKDKNKPIITCCASGARSASAKVILETNGFSDVHNGGSWQSLIQKIK